MKISLAKYHPVPLRWIPNTKHHNYYVYNSKYIICYVYVSKKLAVFTKKTLRQQQRELRDGALRVNIRGAVHGKSSERRFVSTKITPNNLIIFFLRTLRKK